MKKVGRKRSKRPAAAPVPRVSVAPTRAAVIALDSRIWLLAIPLAVFVTYSFLPSLDDGFLGWDDDENFLKNPDYRGLGVAQVKWAWTTFWVGVYQPLAWLLFEVQYVLCQLDPRGYHLTNVLLHVANAVVLYVLTVVLLIRCRPDFCLSNPWTLSIIAGFATALFAVHPLRVEAVAWVSCQPYLPCILFSMLAVLAYLQAFPADSRPRWGWLLGSFFLFVTAVLFKAVAVTLPAVLLILDFYPLRRFGDGSGRWWRASAWKPLAEKIPFVIVSLVFMGLAIAAKPQSKLPVGHYGMTEGIGRANYGTWFYIIKTIVPIDLIAFYPLPTELNWLKFPFSASIIATVALSAALFLLRRPWPGLLAAWLSYLVILAPNSGIVWISNQIAADRYSYMSMLGLVMVAAAGFCWLWRVSSHWRPGQVGIAMLGLGMLVGLMEITRNQCLTWRDTETLWGHALSHGAGSSFEVHYNLGAELFTQRKYDVAEPRLKESLRLNPGLAKGHATLGLMLAVEGRHQEAETHLAEAVRLSPGYVNARFNLANVLSNLGDFEAAQAHYSEVIHLDPSYAEAYNSSAMIWAACPEAKFRNSAKAVELATRACADAMEKSSHHRHARRRGSGGWEFRSGGLIAKDGDRNGDE